MHVEAKLPLSSPAVVAMKASRSESARQGESTRLDIGLLGSKHNLITTEICGEQRLGFELERNPQHTTFHVTGCMFMEPSHILLGILKVSMGGEWSKSGKYSFYGE